MSARRQIVQVAAKGAMVLGGLFVVTVVLAAIPGHRAPVVPLASMGSDQGTGAQESAQQNPPAPDQKMDHGKMAGMPGMDMDDAKANEHAAMSDMSEHHHGEHHSEHMFMTSPRKATAEDERRAEEIVRELRTGIEKYKDYHVALNEGYKIFLPNLPQPEYHFTRTATGYDLVGAMYTMPKRASEEQLNARVPLSIAMWHLHTNLCMPAKDQRANADWTKFGLQGSITTQEACDTEGGRFLPVVFGWMTHVYPYEDSQAKIFAMHRHD
jgi:hypothetical protein